MRREKKSKNNLHFKWNLHSDGVQLFVSRDLFVSWSERCDLHSMFTLWKPQLFERTLIGRKTSVNVNVNVITHAHNSVGSIWQMYFGHDNHTSNCFFFFFYFLILPQLTLLSLFESTANRKLCVLCWSTANTAEKLGQSAFDSYFLNTITLIATNQSPHTWTTYKNTRLVFFSMRQIVDKFREKRIVCWFFYLLWNMVLWSATP